jgi:hypothetical protein
MASIGNIYRGKFSARDIAADAVVPQSVGAKPAADNTMLWAFDMSIDEGDDIELQMEEGIFNTAPKDPGFTAGDVEVELIPQSPNNTIVQVDRSKSETGLIRLTRPGQSLGADVDTPVLMAAGGFRSDRRGTLQFVQAPPNGVFADIKSRVQDASLAPNSFNVRYEIDDAEKREGVYTLYYTGTSPALLRIGYQIMSTEGVTKPKRQTSRLVKVVGLGVEEIIGSRFTRQADLPHCSYPSIVHTEAQPGDGFRVQLAGPNNTTTSGIAIKGYHIDIEALGGVL